MDLLQAKTRLAEGHYTCVFCKGDSVLTSDLRGVRPLLNIVEQKRSLQGYSAADRVVGRGAAFLYGLLGVVRLYALVISRPALEVLQQQGIAVEYDTLVPAIRNRQGDGVCPIEQATIHCSSPEDALAAIYQALRALS